MLARCLLFIVFFGAGLGHLRAEPTTDVQTAIDRGVQGLRTLQFGDGCWGEYGPGSTGLVMTALMECGVASTDKSIKDAAAYVRYESLRSKYTYAIAISIIALDRVGNNDDWELIRLLTNRLISGQQGDGGWSYSCPLGELGDLEKSIPAPAGGPAASNRNDLKVGPNNTSDNSNTQFAILALWIGHRYDVDVEAALRKSARRFRGSAMAAGPGQVGWGYTQSDAVPTGARSCCGLLGLALHHGLGVERRLKSANDGGEGKAKTPPPPVDPMKDSMVQEAFRYIHAQFVIETNRQGDSSGPADFYFLWSFERVAVAYGLDRTFGSDWYKMGVRRILPLQQDNGLWKGHYGYEPESSFCLLFLCRSNLTRDLVSLLNPSKAKELKTDGTPAAPPAPPEKTVAELMQQFIAAASEQREKLLMEYRDHKGLNYTDAMAKLIPKVDGIWPKTLRDALATRLARMTVATLRERLKDADAELRRAAAVAAAMKDDKSLIPDLIAALDDREPWVVRAAGVALSRLTGQDFGPPPNATPEQRSKSIAAWKDWWAKRPM